MKIKTLGWLLGVTALASSASIVACSQAPVQCRIGAAGSGIAYAVKYYPVGTPGAACAAPGDEIGFDTYHPKGPGEEGLQQPDFTVPSIVAFQNSSMGSLIADRSDQGSEDPVGKGDQNEETGAHIPPQHPAYVLGKFSTVEPVDEFCSIADPKPAEQVFPKVEAVPPDPNDPDDMGSPEVPAMSVKYEWSDVKVYVTPSAQGTQFSGHLKYTQDTCSAEYNVAGVWPSIFCGVDKEVDDGMGGKMTVTVPEASLCCPNADPLGGRITGSGINPDFPMKCDPDLLLCVLDTPDPTKLPVLNPGWDTNVAACKVTEESAAP